MTNFISYNLPYATLLAHVVLVALVLAVVARRSWGGVVFNLIGKHAVLLGFLASLSAIGGSLFYSEMMGFTPCTLCWWIRVGLYPLAGIFGVALFKGERGRDSFAYALPLVLFAFVISLYYSYFSLGGVSLLPCTAGEGSCNQIFVKEFGYITIPMMSLTLVVYILFISWVNKLYKNEDSHAR